MKKTLFALLVLTLGCNSSQKTASESSTTSNTAKNATNFAETITEAELKEHLYVYASDEFEGRDTGSEGQKKAVAYLKAHYEKLGIPAAKKDGDYFQKVPIESMKTPNGTITVGDKTYTIGTDFVSLSAMNADFDEIVYVGYGLDEETYSDYKGRDVKGKLVLVKAGEPKNADGTYKLSGTNEKAFWNTPSDAIGLKANIAEEMGAKGMLYYDASSYPAFVNYFNRLKENQNGQMSLKSKNPVFFKGYVNSIMAKAILENIDTNTTPQVISIKIASRVTASENEIDSENVVALLKGSEKPDEYLIISSHLDHIGINEDGAINNGADDDGSGSVALLEIAEAFKKAADAGVGPKRSILFLHVTGEEKGLLGSQYYTDMDPIVPLEKTVADLNIDMIGRINPKREGDRNYVYLIGSDKLSTDLHELSEKVNEKFMNIELDYTYNDENDPNRFYYRSDHYNFAKNNIPVIFYFNGTHEDYHRPGDTPDKINYDLLENRTRLIFYTAWEIANRDQRVIVDKPTN